jgi:hypothetical protein
MRRLLLTLGLAGACASGLFATGAAAAIPDGPLGMRAAASEPQEVQQAAWVCRGGYWHRRCFHVYGGPYASFRFGGWHRGWGHRWHHR